ncbi:Predicted arabinose efflux permease, MFS family [Catalinimonas alkaloidigena]|uniref:Predicted arabinose efflux permease, MFS family n=1 Tax=Catalinimonas alkaloidigena TaxID=1075417 RepID=A0A1G9KE22_9BACT|nr:MFS transporter [Catalinimonas alkaloidigena]SDL47583.1 Predicted arabinose efflux permease, MFS family [Catalinimonas alkaloidigena]
MKGKRSAAPVQWGLRENLGQFLLLVLINGFVGGMVGLERSILPPLAAQAFGVVAPTALLSFILVFGVTKALTNYVAGTVANRIGRKRLLVYGWWVGLPVPLLLMWAPHWGWVIVANVLLGIQQGLCWSTTVVMKIDLVGEKHRGIAMGINEFAGYIAIAAVALATGWLASTYGLRPYPFVVGLGLAVLGLLASIGLVQDTTAHVRQEGAKTQLPHLNRIFRETTWRHPNLGAVTQAGLVNNLNDGMVWGLLPVVLAQRGFSLTEIGFMVAVYPAVWGVGQLVTGALADVFCKKNLLFWGMSLQGLALLALPWAWSLPQVSAVAVVLGLGTALVYPTFLAAIAADTHPTQRAESLGIFRFWRDLGYAVGALLTGLLADNAGPEAAMGAVAGLTLLSAGWIRHRMSCATTGTPEWATA